MDDSQYKTIEQQALQIVGTLNKLKEEIEGYRDARLETQRTLDSLDGLLDAVADAAKQVGDAANDLRKSDYVETHEKMSAEAEMLTSACETLQQNLEGMPKKVKTMLKTQQTAQGKAQSAFAAQLEEIIEADASSRKEVQKGIEAACEGVVDRFDHLPTIIMASLDAYETKQAEKDRELIERVSNLEKIIARIDRNTQKGFGKERG